MSTTRYRIYNCKIVNVRRYPSINASVICTLECGQTVQVVDGYSSTKEQNGKKITWFKIKSNNKEYYMSSAYLRKVINYQEKVGLYADKVFKKILELKCKHGYGATTYNELNNNKSVTCATSVSIALQLSGLLKEGKFINHTTKNGNELTVNTRKNSKSKAIIGLENLKEGTYTIHKVMKLYKNMDRSLKEKGTVYIQNSNVCINAGDNKIYSCNNASNQLRDGKYIRNKCDEGYPFSHLILYAITFNKEW